MTDSGAFAYQLVDAIPEVLETGVVYVSHRYSTASHLCACGCKSEVVTPLGAGGWRLNIDDRGVSLSPSIGNASFVCKSHYFITCGRVLGEGSYTEDMIKRARRRDNPRAHVDQADSFTPSPTSRIRTLLASWLRRLFGRK